MNFVSDCSASAICQAHSIQIAENMSLRRTTRRRISSRSVVPTIGLSNSNTWKDFGDLTKSFTLKKKSTVQVFYQITMSGGNTHLVTRLLVDGRAPRTSRTITGNTAYWGNSNTYINTFLAGNHTIKVQYRTPFGGTNNPGVGDWNSRVLTVLVFE